MQRKTPVRSCFVCRGRALKRELARLVVAGGTLGFDRLQVAQSRGLYVHPRAECINGVEARLSSRGRGAPQLGLARGIAVVVEALRDHSANF